MMRLYYTPNLNPRLAVASARHLGAPITFVRAAPRDPRQREAFRPINPNTLAPVLIDGDLTLWETDAIVCHLSRKMGSDFWREGAAQVEMIRWISWATHHFLTASSPIYFDRIVRPTFTTERADPAEIAAAMAEFREFAAILDAHLSGRDWIADDRLCYADFRAAAALPYAERAGLPLAEFPAIAAWHDRLMQIAAWRAPFDGLA